MNPFNWTMRSWSCDLLPNDMRADSPEDLEGEGERLVYELYSSPRVVNGYPEECPCAIFSARVPCTKAVEAGHVPGGQSLSAYFISSVSTSLPFSL
jgi:hypothetical protein